MILGRQVGGSTPVLEEAAAALRSARWEANTGYSVRTTSHPGPSTERRTPSPKVTSVSAEVATPEESLRQGLGDVCRLGRYKVTQGDHIRELPGNLGK